MYDAIVVGGGIVGMSAAYNLARGGAKALLIDRHHTGRATDAGAGILAPATSGITLPQSWFVFGVRCVDYYPVLVDQLRQEQADDTGYAVCGKLTVAVDDDEIAAFENARNVVAERQRTAGIPAVDDLRDISADEAKALFPPLADVQRAFYYSQGARVDAAMLTRAMGNAARTHKLEQRDATVDALVIDDGAVTGVAVDGETIHAGKVIIAGGAWSSRFGDQVGAQIPVEPKRGQIIHLHVPDADTANWPVVVAFHGHYMLAWPGGRVVAGATRELGVGFNPVPTAAGMQEVFGEALRVAPGLATAQFQEIRIGLRPHTADNLPVLGEIPGVDNLFVATGHGASGLQLGPYSGKLAADWALGHPLETDISAFRIGRFLG